MVVSYILLLVVLILVIVLVCVQEINLILKNLILLMFRGSLDSIWYSKDSNVSLAGFSDVDWASNAVDRKSTSGGYFYLGSNLVSWHNKKQNYISLLIAEAKYIAVGSCCTQLLRRSKCLQIMELCWIHL